MVAHFNWHESLRELYTMYNPSRVSDIPTILEIFKGFEESLWLSLCSRYGTTKSPTTVEREVDVDSAAIRLRIARIYARYAPAKLFTMENTIDLMRLRGTSEVFKSMEDKYAAEPPIYETLTLLERARVLVAFHGVCEQLESLPSMINSLGDREDLVMAKLAREVGPEPSVMDMDHPDDPKQRLWRIFVIFDPDMVVRIDALLERYHGDALRLFGVMQQRYGPQPTVEDVRRHLSAGTAHATVDTREVEIKLQADRKKRREAEEERLKKELENQQQQIQAAQKNTAFVVPLVNNIVRNPCIDQLRSIILSKEMPTLDQSLQLTQKLFHVYERSMVPVAAKLVRARYSTTLREGLDWLSLLDVCYSNAEIPSEEQKLRTTASLIEFRYGAQVTEVHAVGGIDAFVDGIDAVRHAEWAMHLVMTHGRVTEDDLGLRNRCRRHVAHYAGGMSRAGIGALVERLFAEHEDVPHFLTQTLGPPPPPPRVDARRVAAILARHAPWLRARAAAVVDAHADAGEGPEEIVANVARSYGPERGPIDDAMERILAEEMNERFRIFVTEGRTREMFGRRRTAVAHHRDLGALLQQEAAQAADEALYSQVRYVKRATSEAESRMREDLLERRLELDSQMQKCQLDEAQKRTAVLQLEKIERRDVREEFERALGLWSSEDANFELAEKLQRNNVAEDAALALAQLSLTEKESRAQVGAWLAERMKWRKMWHAQDVARRKQLEELYEARQSAATKQLEISKAPTYDQMLEALTATKSAPKAPQEYETAQAEAQLWTQATKVLEFNAAVDRERIRLRQSRANDEGSLPQMIPVSSRRSLHANCTLQHGALSFDLKRAETEVIENPTAETGAVVAQTIEDDSAQLHLELREYVKTLVQRSRLPLENADDLLARYPGKEALLIAALEQQANVTWAQEDLRDRLQRYYRVMAPAEIEEIDALLAQFTLQQEALIWKYVTSKYGPVPFLFSNEQREYVRGRLVRYLESRAPHLLSEVDFMVRRVADNGDTLFADLTKKYGPEDRNVQIDTLARKLRTFFRRRRLNRPSTSAEQLAQRYIGRETLLFDLLREKFGDSPEDQQPYVGHDFGGVL